MPRMQRRSARSRAQAQQVRRDLARREAYFRTLAAEFETDMQALGYQVCSSCLKRTSTSDIVDSRCSTCRRSRFNLFSRENSMDLGEIPPELQVLTFIETILIARIHPVVSLFKIRGQQRAYSGHVMNFSQHIDNLAVRLPHDPSSLTAVVLLNRDTPNGLIQFKVRSMKVREALVWLQRNNIYYHDIIIDEDRLADLPDDGDICHLLANLSIDNDGPDNQDLDNMIDRSCIPNIPLLDSSRVIAENLRRVDRNQDVVAGDWPDLSQNPQNEFTSEGLICKAFPVLFPYGRGDLRSPRIQSIQKHLYFKYLMNYQDGRFANDPRFPYYAYNSLARWDALNCGSVYVRLHRMEGIDAEDMRAMAADPNHDLASSIMYYGASLRGTRSYWKQRCTELIQMVRQLGTPTIFFTLSAADYHWPDLFRILSPQVDPETLSERDRRILMHDNPTTVAWFFDQRCSIFMKKFLTEFFNVKDYWYRYEWQFRGSPHIHGLLWLDDAPDCSDISSLNASSKARIVEYFDDLVSACVNERFVVIAQNSPCRQRLTDLTPEQQTTDLDRILSSVQRHSRCGDHCMRRKRGSRRMACRFGFPIDLEESSDLRLDAGAWKFIPKRNDSLLQRYNGFVSRLWRGNTDFSAITSKDAVLNYISKYASKGEHSSPAYSEVLARLFTRNPDQTPAATLIRQLLVSSVAERNYSAQEVMHLLMGWPLYHASRTMTVLSLRNDWQRLGQEASNNTVDHYSSRGEDLESISLYTYAKNYHCRAGRTIKRRKECIVRVIPHLKLSDDFAANEEYYMLQCKLHIPWRDNFEDILPDGMSWENFYLINIHDDDDSDSFSEDFPHLPDEFEFQEPDNIGHVVRDADFALARLQPNPQQVDPLGLRPIDEAHAWQNPRTANITFDEVSDYLNSFREGDAEPRAELAYIPYERMSPAQKVVCQVLREQYSSDCQTNKRVMVQGKAGTGKSALIMSMCRKLNTVYNVKAYEILAPTGAAAVNIDGKTIHSFLRIPVQGPMLPLNGESLRNFQMKFRNIKFIIIDEYSMIGMRLLHKIHNRLCEASGLSEEPFGGFFIYFFGDLRQLPPVKDVPIYMEPNDDFSQFSISLINSIQKKVILTQCHRQDVNQTQFKEVLDSLATGRITVEGWRLLMTRRDSIRPSNINTFTSPIYLFPTNAQVKELNTRILANNAQPVAVIQAEHNNSTARQGSDVVAQGLSNRLYLSLNCRVMLRKNICVERGLVNGSLGTVRQIIFRQDERPPSLPLVLLIEFDKFTGPYFQGRLFPLLPMVVTWREKSIDCSRKQFPINLAYAFTIHKAQGLTLDKAIIDIGVKETAPGLTYVALSRVRRLDDLLFSTPFDFSRLSSIGTMRQVIARERFLETMEHQ